MNSNHVRCVMNAVVVDTLARLGTLQLQQIAGQIARRVWRGLSAA
jgi:hypothetical protein